MCRLQPFAYLAQICGYHRLTSHFLLRFIFLCWRAGMRDLAHHAIFHSFHHQIPGECSADAPKSPYKLSDERMDTLIASLNNKFSVKITHQSQLSV